MPIHVRVGTRGSGEIFIARRRGDLWLEVDDDADRIPATERAIGLHGPSMCAQQVVRCERRLEQIAMPRRERAVQVAAVGDHPRLVERGPYGHAVERLEHQCAVVGEPVGDVAIEPSAQVVQRGGEVPVVERRHRFDVRGDERVDQPPIEIDTALICAPLSVRQHATPTNAEAVGLQAERAHQRDVVGIAMVVVAGNVAGIAAGGQSGRMREALPDARARAVVERRPFDLIRRGGRAPQKTGRKLEAIS